MKRLRSDISYTIYSLFFSMACEKLRQRISHWSRLSGPVFHMSQGRWMDGLISPVPFVDCVCPWLHACLPARRLNGCSSAYCWDSGLILLHPHHGLALTHPWSLFTHWLFCPLPPTASLDRILPLSRHGTQASKQTGSCSCALYMHSVSRHVKSLQETIERTQCTSFVQKLWCFQQAE